jgi:hypothetical protein
MLVLIGAFQQVCFCSPLASLSALAFAVQANEK